MRRVRDRMARWCLARAIATSGAAASAQAPSDEPVDAQPSEPRTDERAPDDARADEPERAEGDQEDAPRVDTWRWPGVVVWDLALRLAIPERMGFDRSIEGHGYDNVRLVPTVVAGLSVPAGVEWLWIGGQLGVRGRTWSHAEREDASMVGVDLLATVHARFLLGQVVELGAAVGGGAGWIAVVVNGVVSDQVVPRFNVQAELAFRVGRHFAIGPRVGWDYFVREGINAYGDSVDAGGPYFGLSLEGRE